MTLPGARCEEHVQRERSISLPSAGDSIIVCPSHVASPTHACGSADKPPPTATAERRGRGPPRCTPISLHAGRHVSMSTLCEMRPLDIWHAQDDVIEGIALSLHARMAAGAMAARGERAATPPGTMPALHALPLAGTLAARDRTATSHQPLSYERFSELVHPLEGDDTADAAARARLPSADAVRAFLERLHRTLAIDASVLVMTLIYVERVLACNGWPLLPETWRRMVLAGLLCAAKLQFDEIVWNVDLTAAFPAWRLGDVNELELFFCAAMRYALHVRSSTWAHCYFSATSLVHSARRLRPPAAAS